MTGAAVAEIRTAIAELEKVAEHAPAAWQCRLFIGKGEQALGNLERAYETFQEADRLDSENELILCEFAGVCLQLGRAAEAVAIGERAACIKPDDFTILGNLACAYVIARKHAEATRTINRALELMPNDEVNRNLQTLIADIVSGKRPQPECLNDLLKPPKKSIWERLQFWKW